MKRNFTVEDFEYQDKKFVFYCNYYCCLVIKSCLILCDPMDYSPPGSSVHGISQARILSGLPFPPPGDFSDPGSNPCLLSLLHWQAESLPLSHLESHKETKIFLHESGVTKVVF